MNLTPFTEAHLRAAAELLAQRHRAHREAEPLLPARFEEPATALKTVEAVWRTEGASGVAAVSGERLIGFMLGTAHDDLLRGRHVWVPLAGHAIAPGEDAELYRELYAVLAQRWVDEGHFYHLAQVPASDEPALDAWFRLTFAHEQAYALRPLEPLERPPTPAGLEICQAGQDDLERIMEVADWIARWQVGTPVFGICLPEARVGWRKGWSELLADPNAVTWLALRDGQIIAYYAIGPAPSTDEDLMTPDRCVEVEIAATRADARGHGIGRFLAAMGFAVAYEMGFRSCLNDWRVANLPASRFWLRQGFLPVVYRISRRIDPRITWARGDRGRLGE